MWIRRVTVMNTGIGDAVNVGWKLAHILQDRADPSLLDTYESERIGLCAFPRGATDRACTGWDGEGVVAEFTRRIVAPLIFRRRDSLRPGTS